MSVFCVLSFAMLEHCFEFFFKRSRRNSECANFLDLALYLHGAFDQNPTCGAQDLECSIDVSLSADLDGYEA
jgi:hypothetical protein